ncbi:fatty acid oxidation complex subunit alpha FadJ [Alteromonadaceae bacterium BrNp21-10]|nr:fatty acid oxidation complex subunit alpha FadJ [Alteromonadaceae bacterium BrNp21-10]
MTNENMNNEKDSPFSLQVNDQGIATITMDVVGESMNTLKAEFGGQIAAVLDQIAANKDIKGVILASGKDNSFVAGADISMLDACTTALEAQTLSADGQAIMQRIEDMTIPFVAAIHGPALGGGLELALCCHYRVCSDSDSTIMGVPEVQLGLLPGSGGTQRLPRLIGIQQAMTMMLTGKQLRPKQAKKCGLVDDVVPKSVLLDVAAIYAAKGKPKPQPVKLNLVGKVLEKTPFGRQLLFKQARKQTVGKTRGNYPAPERIIDVIEAGVGNIVKGYKLESHYFGNLVMTPESKQLRNIFFATTEMKKEQGVAGVEPQKVQKAGILGGGLMGGGIAFVTGKAKVPVRIKDIRSEGIANAIKYSYDILNTRVKRRIISRTQMQKQLAMLTGGTDYKGFENADIVIEAVFEDLELKQQMVADVEQSCRETTIFASNTSSIPITQIAAKAARPEQVIGLHYFSPVDKMPLAEVIAHEKTSDQTISTTVAFARKQGKTPIVVKDGAGFYVNRILAPYMNEAACILLAGEPIEHIDKALLNFGFPVGPMKLLDEVGIDVGSKISPILVADLGPRFEAPDAFTKLLADDRKGKKNQRGLYDYIGKKSGKNVDESVYSLLGINPSQKLSHDQIAERCVLLMLNEAAMCLDEGVIRNARDGDIATIFGIGFPPFLGGPFRYMDSLGIDHVVARLTHYQKLLGAKFTPAAILTKMANDNATFY